MATSAGSSMRESKLSGALFDLPRGLVLYVFRTAGDKIDDTPGKILRNFLRKQRNRGSRRVTYFARIRFNVAAENAQESGFPRPVAPNSPIRCPTSI